MTEALMPDPRIPRWETGDFLRKAREHAGLDQAALAADLGISRNTVVNYEGNKVALRRAVVMAWAMRTGVPLEWLLGGEQPHPGGGGDGVGPAGLEPTTSAVEGPHFGSLHLVRRARGLEAVAA